MTLSGLKLGRWDFKLESFGRWAKILARITREWQTLLGGQMFKTEREIKEAISIVETGEGFSIAALLIDILEEIAALKFGAAREHKNEKQVKQGS